MGIIQVMDEHLANQIAAGEVVERPASIVKELVENAIDAKATRIQIRIEEGGISYIQVSDNGVGMDKEDAILAFHRHATSKIKREKDLFSIRTLGFRGEALPSIASVARVIMTTSHDASQPAVTIRLEGGEWISTEETEVRARGTDVIVKDLFYNTPARLKYLKTVNTEVSHVADVVGRLALAHPDIAFSLKHHQRELFRTAGDGKLLHVLHALYGKQVASRAIKIQANNLDFSIDGFVVKPEITRASRSYLTIILNGRNVRSIPISQAVLRAYGTLLPTGRYPIGVLRIKMDPKLVDVNVHPAKLEVRLSKEKECCQLIEEAIKKAFEKERIVPEFSYPLQKREKPSLKPIQESLNFDGKNQEVETPKSYDRENKPKHDILVHEKSDKNPEQKNKQNGFYSTLLQEEKTNDLDSQVIPLREDMDLSQHSTAARESSYQPVSSSESPSSVEQPLVEEREDKESRFPSLLPLAQIHGTYIVAQSEDGFYLIDQHAAHERIYYEEFSRRLGEENQEQIELLVPLTIECSPSEAEVLNEHLEQLKRWGLEIEPFGGATFIVRASPVWFPREDAVKLVHEIVEWLKEHGKVSTSELRDASAKMMSCKAAIKANRHLRQDEMESLLHSLGKCENPFTCPHGRPILVHFSTYELEKMFKRVM